MRGDARKGSRRAHRWIVCESTSAVSQALSADLPRCKSTIHVIEGGEG
jgi:hypothetical protein